jgi:hypothetical protein
VDAYTVSRRFASPEPDIRYPKLPIKLICVWKPPRVENGEKTIRNNDSTDDLHTRQIDIPETRFPKEVKDATDVLSLFLKGEVSLSDINNSDALNVIRTNIEHFRQSRSKCRTAKLWFQYMDMICILRHFKKAERTGNWNMHLESLKSMLPYANIYALSS